ncbi:MAG: aminotransferase class V-fold PLP-dependent enzyme [Acidobacteriota bacterium]|nr:aminotransferase class V-fold PLP-dependent enzyme [Blastocatellia bacterium]MDW8239535.1 aminotransferase class V-fold PLP-dependent enzyme [Acidobacteriota bacterium]
MKRIYLDKSATTSIYVDVLAAMLPYFYEDFSNASLVHSVGQRAKAAMEKARSQVA